ncbi:MAG: Ni/Fe-hydrogenase, b-type cytochrome subunit [Sulfurimonas sp.]|jgi:Ni/Fe-hydrogenase 1 B-type cytochrome subunit|nr:Ni/Fe-hydrogenase, b-type cytochrome subunit [Sulfurimonas sp.]
MISEANNNIEIVQEIEQELEFSSVYRWQHWIRAISIVVLTITGFYIAVPFLTPAVNADPTNFMQALIRSWHIIFGFVLISAVLFKSYLFVFGRKHEMERAAIKDIFNPVIWAKQIGYYLLISKHPKLNGVYNPIQFMAYLGFYLMIFTLITTGLILYVHVYHDGLGAYLYDVMKSIEVMMGGLAIVRSVHHILTWGVMLFILGHVYMAIYNAVFGKEGGMDAIFSGMKWHKKH